MLATKAKKQHVLGVINLLKFDLLKFDSDSEDSNRP